MKAFVIGAAFLGLSVFLWGMMTLRSDIQIIFATIGLFSAAILFGIAAILRRLDRNASP